MPVLISGFNSAFPARQALNSFSGKKKERPLLWDKMGPDREPGQNRVAPKTAGSKLKGYLQGLITMAILGSSTLLTTSCSGVNNKLEMKPASRILGLDDFKFEPLILGEIIEEIDRMTAECPNGYAGYQSAIANPDQTRRIARIESRLEYATKNKQDQYRQALNASRLDPGKAKNPLADNVMVIASSAQREITYGNTVVEKFTELIEKSPSVGEAVGELSAFCIAKPKYVENEAPHQHYFPPNFQTVMTTKRDEPHWKNAISKADNENPLIRRIVLLMWTKDDRKSSPLDFKQYAANFGKCFNEQSLGDYWAHGDKSKGKGIRVDRIISVESSTPEQIKADNTMHVKIHNAYKEAEKFVELERQKAVSDGQNPDLLQFEFVSAWFGHGTSEKPAATVTTSPASQPSTQPSTQTVSTSYHEGSEEFIFHTEDPCALREAEIKAWEKQYLGKYKLGYRFYNSCHSGAATSDASKLLSNGLLKTKTG